MADQGRYGEDLERRGSAEAAAVMRPLTKVPATGPWFCPNDETVNEGDVCVICGMSRPVPVEDTSVSEGGIEDTGIRAEDIPDGHSKSIRRRKGLWILAAVLGAVLLAGAVFLLIPKGWQQTKDGYYYYDFGARREDAWLQHEGRWYRFGGDGRMLTGWQQIDGSLYYFGGDGSMRTGWVHEGNRSRYMGADGKMYTGWWKLDGQDYCFGEDGWLVKNCFVKTESGIRYLGAAGTVETGWVTVGADTYWMGTDGNMDFGWQQIGTETYYLGTDGIMRTGWHTVDGKRYYFGNDGAMRTGWLELDGETYYLKKDGAVQTGWQQIGSDHYYFREDGTMAVNCFVYGKYFLDAGGKRVTGWLDYGGSRYHFGEDGEMDTGDVRIGGELHRFRSDGKLLWTQRELPSSAGRFRFTDQTLTYTRDNGYASDCSVLVLDDPVENCVGFTLELNVNDIEAGKVDHWDVLIRKTDGTWMRVKDFWVAFRGERDAYGSVQVTFSEPVSFTAFACPCLSLEWEWSFGFALSLVDITVRDMA